MRRLLLLFGLGCAAESGMPVAYPGFDDLDQTKRTFVVIGDTQRTSNWEFWRERNFEETRKLLAEIARRDPAWIVHAGDLTVRGSSQDHWEDFEAWQKPILEKKIPCFPVFGNHEYYGGNETARSYLFKRFPALKERMWYSFRFKGVGVILFNSNFDELSAEEKKGQNEWYLKELAAMEQDPAVRSIVACCHHPPYSNGLVVGRSVGVETLFAEPFIQSAKGAFFFTGHCHTYERFLKGGKQFIVTGGGGGPRHAVNLDEKRREFKDEFKGPRIRPFHFCELEIQEGALECRMVGLGDDGTFKEMDRARVETPAARKP